MKRQIILIGIGQTGCDVAEKLTEKLNKGDACCRIVALDTDEDTLSGLSCCSKVSLASDECVSDAAERLGAEETAKWFPLRSEASGSEFVKRLGMDRGTCGWRAKALLAFNSFISDPDRRDNLHCILDECTGETELYIVASLAGGTGSGLFLPIALYVKEYIKRIGGYVRISRAVLVMPSVYESAYGYEQKVKSSANAYAALRELNAVNTVTLLDNTECGQPINFKIACPTGYFDTLFDSNCEKYKCLEYRPFDRVVLFERIPGNFSVAAHIEPISEAVVALVKGDGEERGFENEKTPAVYSVMSVSKVRYPYNSIVKYISKKIAADFANQEICDMHIKACAAVKDIQKTAKAAGRRLSDDFLLYCENYIRVTEEASEHECGDSLFAEWRETDKADTEAAVESIICGVERAIELSFVCDAATKISQAVDAGCFDAADCTEKIKNKKQAALRNAEQARELLEDFCSVGLRLLDGGKDDFETELIKGEDTDGKFSLLEYALKDNGKYIHPIYAVYRLCRLYIYLRERCGTESPSLVMTDEDGHIRDWLLDIYSGHRRKNKYTALGNQRFGSCLYGFEKGAEQNSRKEAARIRKKNKELLCALCDAEKLLFYDLGYVYAKIKGVLCQHRRRDVLDTVKTLIIGYRRLAQITADLEGELEAELRLCAVHGSADVGGVSNVGASVEKKQDLYRSYISEFKRTQTEQDLVISSIGETIGSQIVRSRDAEVSFGDVRYVISCVEKKFEEQLCSSEFFGDEIYRGIIEVLLDSPHTSGTLKNGKVFVGRSIAPPLGAAMNDQDRARLNNVTVAVLSEQSKEQIVRLEDFEARETAEMFVERKMYDAGEYFGKARFRDGIANNEISLCREITGISLYMIPSLNEDNDDATAYIAYQRAVENEGISGSPMWNPNLIYSGEEEYLLPYISPSKK